MRADLDKVSEWGFCLFVWFSWWKTGMNNINEIKFFINCVIFKFCHKLNKM